VTLPAYVGPVPLQYWNNWVFSPPDNSGGVRTHSGGARAGAGSRSRFS
jgi:hypothetical protein